MSFWLDSKPVKDAVLLIQQGKFSASARMNRFLTNINKIPITVKHLSSKFQLNEIADHQSRNPAPCTAVNCSIHRFINGLTDSVVDSAAKCASLVQDDPSPATLNQGSTSGSVHNTEGRDSAQPDEEAGAVGGEVGVVDSLPEEYRYLRNLNYNQPRQPKHGDIVKYFDFNFEGWLRVRVVSQHKKSSKYAGSVNCLFLDLDREPDGLYFHMGDFWLILQKEGDDPEPVEEVAREDVRLPGLDTPTVSPTPSLRESVCEALPHSGASGLPPVMSSHRSIAPNMVYTIPPPPASVFYSRTVIEKARKLSLHPSQEHMRYAIAQSLTHHERKHSSRSVFSKLRKLGSGRR